MENRWIKIVTVNGIEYVSVDLFSYGGFSFGKRWIGIHSSEVVITELSTGFAVCKFGRIKGMDNYSRTPLRSAIDRVKHVVDSGKLSIAIEHTKNELKKMGIPYPLNTNNDERHD